MLDVPDFLLRGSRNFLYNYVFLLLRYHEIVKQHRKVPTLCTGLVRYFPSEYWYHHRYKFPVFITDFPLTILHEMRDEHKKLHARGV